MSRNRFELIYTALLVPLDAIMLFLAFWSAYLIRFTGIITFSSIMPKDEYFRLVFLAIPIFIILFAFHKLYSFKKRPFVEELASIILAISTALAVIFAIFFFAKLVFFSRLIIVFAWFLAIIFVIIGRLIAKIIQKNLFYRGIGTRKILLIGTGKIADKIISEFSDKFLGFEIVAHLNSQDGNIKDIKNVLKSSKVNEIIIADPNFSEIEMNKIMEFCHDRRIVFKYSPTVMELQTRHIEMNIWGDVPLLELKRTPLDGWGRIIKRIVDIVGSIIALILSSLFFLIVPIIIKFDSKGPVFFKQKRVGLDKNFNFLKFRTMKEGAQKEHNKLMKEHGIMFKLKNDPRITKVGKFLRKTSIDEIPQFINVLKGEMSLVGPRPPMPEEVAHYSNWQKKRLGVKPGITGLWQVSGRSNLSFEEWVKLDKFYIENWSFALDMQILFRTFIVLINKVGAY